jgi:hypothetical protein
MGKEVLELSAEDLELARDERDYIDMGLDAWEILKNLKTCESEGPAGGGHRAGSITSEVTNLGSVRSSSRDFWLDRGLRARISEFHLFGPAWGEWKTEKLEWLTQLSEKTSSKTITIKRWLVGSFLKYQDVQWTC